MSINISNFMSNCLDDERYHSPNLWHILTSKLRFSPTITILIYIIYLLPFCFGVFGNISVCLIFFQQRKLRSITNTFLMNLCKKKRKLTNKLRIIILIFLFNFRSQRSHCTLRIDTDDTVSCPI